jgi:hypothetical protein
MRVKNGFIATSVLYAFLIAFLTLFLGFMASYIQNKQLVNRIENMAEDELIKYGNIRISDLNVGDYVVFDTIDNVGDGATNELIYSSPISPNAKWILFKIDDASEENVKTYYFVSSADAQKNEVLGTGVYSFNYDDGPQMNEHVERGLHYGGLGTVSKIINGNVYYNNGTRTYKSYDNSVTSILHDGNYKVFSYQFMYFINGGIDVRFMNNIDFQTIESLDNDRIKESILNQKTDYTIWNNKSESYGGLNSDGFYLIKHISLSKDDNTSENIHNFCESQIGYGHKVKKDTSDEYYDECYYTSESTDTKIGTCTDDATSTSKCLHGNYNPRYVATIKVTNADNTDGYIDSGNGSYQLPYLITKGVK